MRTSKRLYAQQRTIYQPELLTCPPCGERLELCHYLAWDQMVQPLGGVLRERARLVWRDFDPASVPSDYQGYYDRDQKLANGPYPDDPTPQQVIAKGTSFCIGTPDDCIRFIETYEALGIEEVFPCVRLGRLGMKK